MRSRAKLSRSRKVTTAGKKSIPRGRGAPRTVQEANNVYTKRLAELWVTAKSAKMPKTYWDGILRRAKRKINHAIDLRRMKGKVSARFVIDIILGEIQAINDSVNGFKRRRVRK